MRGIVVSGDSRGHDLGYPTANVDTPIPVDIEDGVYAGYLIDGPLFYNAAISIGTNPTFNGRNRKVEAFVIDCNDLDLYGHHVEIKLVEKIRDQIKFDSVEQLVQKMGQDVMAIREILNQEGSIQTGHN